MVGVNSKPGRDSPIGWVEKVCLKCRKPFMAEDRPGHRICTPCKGTREWKDGNDESWIVVYGTEVK